MKCTTLLASLVLLSFASLVFGVGVTRTVYVQVEEVWWDYLAGTGKNQITGVPIEQDPEGAFYYVQSDDRIGSTYLKARYVEYKDKDFTVLKPKDDSMKHTGILGPVIWAEVGDTVQMVMKNTARFNFSIHPHGVFYSKEAEGAKYPDNALDAGDYIATGQTYTYTWPVPARAGPGPGDFSSIIWPYHSHVAEIFGSNSGLVGLFVITAKGKAWPDGHPKGVDREFVVLLDLYDENRSFYLPATIAEKIPTQVANIPLLFDPLFMESNILNAINGYAYGNAQNFIMKAGERVRWYVYAMGAERDVHSIYWHGQTLMDKFHRTSGEILIPATNFVLDMIPDNVGTWLLQCHVNEHLAHGMVTKFVVEATPDYYDEDRNFATTQDPFPFNTFATFTGSEEIVINSGSYLSISVLAIFLLVVAFM